MNTNTCFQKAIVYICSNNGRQTAFTEENIQKAPKSLSIGNCKRNDFRRTTIFSHIKA